MLSKIQKGYGMKTKDIDINQIQKMQGIDERIKKEIICNFKHQLNTTADNRFKEIKFYHDNCKINIKALCKVFNVSRSGYYEYIKRKKNQKEFKDAKIINAIRSIQEHYDYIYGINKVRLELIRNHRAILKKGTIARNKVYRLMKENGLLSRCICNKGNSILYNPHNSIYRNLIKVSKPTSKLFQRFGTDVCEVKTPEGKLYISVVQEQCCNELFGHTIAKRMAPMEYYYLHKDDETLISDLQNSEYSNFCDLIEFEGTVNFQEKCNPISIQDNS